MKTGSTLMLGVLGLLALGGCVAATSDEGTQGKDNKIAKTTEALGEPGCGTLGGVPYSGSSLNGVHMSTPSCGGNTQAVSANGCGTDSSCPSQFIFEFDVAGLLSLTDTTYAFFAGSSCSGLTSYVGIYYWNASTSSFYLNSAQTYHGAYNSSTNSCYWIEGGLPTISSANTSKARVAIQTTWNNAGTISQKRSQLTVTRPPC